ncbi:MAG: hypothetical protein RLZZ623_1718 [Actinomycetota bacterium]
MNSRVARSVAVAVIIASVVAACADDPGDATTSATTSPATTTTSPATTSTSPASVANTPEPIGTVPPGVLAAVPFQNRLDVAQGIFQVKLYNGSPDALSIVAVQLVWDGLTTAVTKRSNALIAGDRIDFPVALAPAHCVGDGTVADMPDPNAAIARVFLADNRTLEVPVFDVKHFARRLYLEDCERQHIAATVDVEWVDLHETILDDRPVTEGSLRLTRHAGTPALPITVSFISNTINFTFVPVEPIIANGAPAVVVLPADQPTVEVPIRFIEGRCDAHARSESSQPFQFISQIDLGDGLVRPYAVPPAIVDQLPMRTRVEHACDILGASGFAGQDDTTTTTTTG